MWGLQADPEQELGSWLTPGDIAEGSRAGSLGPFPLQLGSGKPPRPGADQSHSPKGGEHSTGGLPLRGIWVEKRVTVRLDRFRCPCTMVPRPSWGTRRPQGEE